MPKAKSKAKPKATGRTKKNLHGGRPSGYTLKIATQICARMSEGESLRSICRDEKMPSKSMVFRWLADFEEFRHIYDIAMEQRSEYWAEEILDISDNAQGDYHVYEDEHGEQRQVYIPTTVQRDKLKVDTRKWLMARMKPKKYGDRSTMDLEGNMVIRSVTHEIIDPPRRDDDDEDD